jgi:aldehyde dehydrogenase
MIYANPGQPGSKITFKKHYDNFIAGRWTPPANGAYFENVSPVNGQVFCEVARSGAQDIEAELDAARESWVKTSAAERANILVKIAQRMEDNLELLPVAETWDNGKPVRETLRAKLP